MASDRPDYWYDTRRPWICLLFVLPLMLVYEIGVASTANAGAVRNGADWWMRDLLGQFGLLGNWVLPGLLIGGLLAWQIVGNHSWRVRISDFTGMAAESLLFAVILVILGHGLHAVLQQGGLVSVSKSSRIISFLGAGIYEEMLFRLALLPALFVGLRLFWSKRMSALLALAGSSLLFALAHHVGDAGESFVLGTFVFRTAAGAFFAGLFLLRGFGIAVGCHALYDVLVGIVLPMPIG